MIQKIELDNFLSYGRQTVEFQEGAFAIIGDNGEGKSSLLESIMFALYGVGRGDLAKLVRMGQKSMKVCVYIQLATSEGLRVFEVERGIAAKKGFLEVRESVPGAAKGSVLATGGADPANNKAQQFIDGLLGCTLETFELTAFFGVGAQDTIMKVRPAERLETMQTLVGTDDCLKASQEAGGRVKGFVAELARIGKEVERLEALTPVEQIEYSIEQTGVELVKAGEVTGNMEDALDAVTKELSDLSVQAAEVNRAQQDYDSIFGKFTRAKSAYDVVAERVTKSVKVIEGAELELKALNEKPLDDKGALSDESAALTVDIADLNMRIQLKSIATGESDSCPLCSATVTADERARWKVDVADMEAKRTIAVNALRVAKDKLTALEAHTGQVRDLENRISSYKAQQAALISERTAHESTLAELTDDLKLLKDKLDVSKQSNIAAAMQEGVAKKSKVMRSLQESQAAKGQLTEQLKGLRNSLQESQAAKESIAALNKKREKVESDLQAATLVQEAFSRYGIPFDLLKSLREKIEDRATVVYREFKNGGIITKDTTGTKPGVDFVLIDGEGERTYSMLSTGEKVMMYLAVRVAITQIVGGGSKVRFLVLDEIAGNLSPEKRDDLVRLINKVLRKYFVQVFMVSHTLMRDIFNVNYLVKKVDGMSTVEEV